MKLKIDVELDAGEAELAQELVVALRALTQHVNVKVLEHHAQPQLRAAPTTPPGSPPRAVVSEAAPTRPVPAPEPQPARAAPAQPSQPSQQPPQEPPPQQPADPERPNGNAGAPWRDWLGELAAAAGDSPRIDRATRLIVDALAAAGDEPQSPAYLSFKEALEALLWTEGPRDASHVAPLCELLLSLPMNCRKDAQNVLIKKSMTHLAQDREINKDRADIFVEATAFASLVRLSLIDRKAAVTTVTKLLSKEVCAGAALMMLSKMVELCCGELKELLAAEPAAQRALQATLAAAPGSFDYDKQYICTWLGWPNAALAGPAGPAAAAPQPPPPPPLPRLQPVGSWAGFNSAVKGVFVDSSHGQVVAVTQGGLVTLHSFEGAEIFRLEPQAQEFRALDLSPTSGLLAVAATAAGAAAPSYLTFQVSSGRVTPAGARAASPAHSGVQQLACLPDGASFVTGETTQGGASVLKLFRAADLAGLQPSAQAPVLRVIETRHSLLTALASSLQGGQPRLVSGNRNGRLTLWDAASWEPLATLLPPHEGQAAEANIGVVTCLETLEGLVLAGAYGQGVNIWDVRSLGNGGARELRPAHSHRLDEHVVTRLVAGPGLRQVAVASVESIHVVQLAPDGGLEGCVAGQKAMNKFYFAGAWRLQQGSAAPPLLYAASAGATVDVYKAVAV